MQILVLGAGQLAMMMAQESADLGLKVSAYDVTSDKVVDPISKDMLSEGLASAVEQCDVITAEFEHIPPAILATCQQSGKLIPDASAIQTGGDRRIEKQRLDKANVANAPYQIIQHADEIPAAADNLGMPLVLKTALDGYDGKGQWRIMSEQDIEPVKAEVTAFLANSDPRQGIVAEAFVNFSREVSVIGARNQQGEIVCYPITENLHHQGILHLSLAEQNAPEALQKQAEELFAKIATSLNYVGVLAVECFVVDETLLVNEIAPRVHNSGHWTQQGATTSQFANHLRAVAGLTLGATEQTQPTAMINILGEDSVPDALGQIDGVFIHWYGKQKRPGRKMGHINVVANSAQHLEEKLREIAISLSVAAFPVIHQRYR